MHKIYGMTLIGMLLTMAAVGLSAVVLMQVIPVYLQYYELQSSISSLRNLDVTEFSTDPAANADILRSHLFKQLDVNSINYIRSDQIIIRPNAEDSFDISVSYQVIRPLVANISFLFNFKSSQELKINAPQ